MDKYPKLNLPPIRLRVKRQNDTIYAWDYQRATYLMLTPEEWVRRHVIALLTQKLGIARELICQEMPVNINGTDQRADIVVVDSSGVAKLLCECKAPDIKIDGSVLAQAVRYNSVLCADIVVLTNGLEHRVYKHDDSGYTQVAYAELRNGYLTPKI